mgnify:FL=1
MGETANETSNIKTEEQTEVNEVQDKTGDFLCPECSASFPCEEYFVRHVREHHCDTMYQESPQSSTSDAYNPVGKEMSQFTGELITTSSESTAGTADQPSYSQSKQQMERPYGCCDCSYAGRLKS